ncbi:MAG TPA: hypothetical protein PLM08_23685, partial [Polyangiaceae bacterium]|nr:hypothetical protein [Polyangiaceae bacterium]
RRQLLGMLGAVGAVVIGIPVGWSALAAVRFPSDRTPEGAYLRIVLALNKGNVRDAFPYLETEAQHALCTIHAYRRKALEIIRKSFREPERSQWENAYREQGDAKDPPELWARLAEKNGWVARLRKDLSGIASIERIGKRATIETTGATRYPFREADNGIWGLTLFTAELVAHKERVSRDLQIIEKTASDYG